MDMGGGTNLRPPEAWKRRVEYFTYQSLGDLTKIDGVVVELEASSEPNVFCTTAPSVLIAP